MRSSNESYTSNDSEEEEVNHPNGNNSMFASLLSPSRLFYSSAKKENEVAISEAAVSFVSSGYDITDSGKNEMRLKILEMMTRSLVLVLRL